MSVLPGLASFADMQTTTHDLSLQARGLLESAEDRIASKDGPLGLVSDAFFAAFNLGWYVDSVPVLVLDEGVDAALASNLGAVAAIEDVGLLSLDFQLFSEGLGSFVIDYASLAY